jgi:hypothetical protein
VEFRFVCDRPSANFPQQKDGPPLLAGAAVGAAEASKAFADLRVMG